MAHLRAGKSLSTVDGTLTRSSDLAALDMHLKLSGGSMARLYAISGLVLPKTPRYATEGHLIGTLNPHGGHWIYEKFNGKFGASDIGHSLDDQTKKPRASLSGTVVSHLLRFSDLAHSQRTGEKYMRLLLQGRLTSSLRASRVNSPRSIIDEREAGYILLYRWHGHNGQLVLLYSEKCAMRALDARDTPACAATQFSI